MDTFCIHRTEELQWLQNRLLAYNGEMKNIHTSKFNTRLYTFIRWAPTAYIIYLLSSLFVGINGEYLYWGNYLPNPYFKVISSSVYFGLCLLSVIGFLIPSSPLNRVVNVILAPIYLYIAYAIIFNYS